MLKKIVLFSLIASATSIMYSSENKIGFYRTFANNCKEICSRPYGKALFTSSMKGGKYGAAFASPLIIAGLVLPADDTWPSSVFCTGLTGLMSALTGSALGTISVLFPLYKKRWYQKHS